MVTPKGSPPPMPKGRRIVVLLSGGLDSTALLYWAKHQGDRPIALLMDYGQRHAKELQAAQNVARCAAVPFLVHKLTLDLKGNALTDRTVPVPSGPYSEGTTVSTFVPFRNPLFLSLAAGYATAIASEGESVSVAIAVHAGDHIAYPDCRQEFVEAMRKVLDLGAYKPVPLMTPFVRLTKGEVIRTVEVLGSKPDAAAIPWGLTWSCYKDLRFHCGVCGTCIERAGAFWEADVPDPTEYMVPPNLTRIAQEDKP